MKRLSYANVTSTMALIFALSGGAYAVTALPRDSVGTAQLKSNAVVGSKIANGSVGLTDLAKSARIPGPRGKTGPTGKTGPAGPSGKPGSSAALADLPHALSGSSGAGTQTVLYDKGGLKMTMSCGQSAGKPYGIGAVFSANVTPKLAIDGFRTYGIGHTYPPTNLQTPTAYSAYAASGGTLSGDNYASFTGVVHPDYEPYFSVTVAVWIDGNYCRSSGAVTEITH